jgi:copper chaperone CopZ
MHSQNDYDIIKKHLLGLQGIIDVKPYYTPKKLCVSFDPNLINAAHIVYGISKLGYHYINRG